jgi:ABC-type sugar transport system permease subunit
MNVNECVQNVENAEEENFLRQQKGKNQKKTFKREGTIFLTVILALPVMHWLVFWLYVNVQSIVLAFQDPLTSVPTLDNFVALWNDITNPLTSTIGVALKNTFLFFALHLFATMPISLCIAFFLYKRIMGYKIFRVIFYFPAIISSLIMVTVFRNFISPEGPLGYIVKAFGGSLPEQGLLVGYDGTPTITIMVYCVWTGFTRDVLLFNGGMSRIPTEVLESAKLEGCGPFREIVSIVLPMIWPTVSTQIVFIFTGMFSAGGPILFLTNGSYQTSTIAFWIFTQVYGDGTIGGSGVYNMVSCAGLCFTLIGVPLILFIKWLLGKVDAVEY